MKLVRSAFAGRPPVLLFDCGPLGGGDACAPGRAMGAGELQAEGLAVLPKMYFTHPVTQDVHEYNSVLNTLRDNGMSRVDFSSPKWSLLWGGHPTPEVLRAFHPFQKTNHFPASWHLGRKDLLWRNVYKMKRQWGREYDIMPHGFVLPDDAKAWEAARQQSPSALWIVKPRNAACGRGIRLFTSSIPAATEKKVTQKASVVQQYVDRPLLINGFKFDLRLYVVVTSYDPLKIYLNEEGLVRLATQKYERSASSLDQRTMHLTNYSVNKHAATYRINSDSAAAAAGRASRASRASSAESGEDDGEDAEAEGEKDCPQGAAGDHPGSSKWSLQELRDHFAAIGQDYDLMMSRIKDLIIKTCLAAEPMIVNAWHQGANFSSLGSEPLKRVGPNQTCFEVYGFDVMVDEQLKPWLLEVNIFPSLSSSSPLDKRIKTKLIADVLTLVGLHPFSHELVERAAKEESLKRLQSIKPRQPAVTTSRDVQSIQAAALKDLGEAEWRLILDAHDEHARRGGLERIYPTADARERYAQYFSSPRYSNLVLARWLEAGGEHLFLPNSRSELPDWVLRAACPASR